jgi:flagellin-like protein
MKIQNEETVSPGKAVTTEDAVSPVIGVILMVAITVILAAVIAAFVFGMAGSTGTSKNVGLTVVKDETNDGFNVTVQGGTDLATLDQLTWLVDGEPGDPAFSAGSYHVGQILSTNGGGNTGVKFSVRGEFSDGSQQILFDRQY